MAGESLQFYAGAGAADAFAVAAAGAAAPETRFRFCRIVEDPAATIVAADIDARRFAVAEGIRESADNFGENPIPVEAGGNKINFKPILALEELAFARYV